ncbi:MAG: hypothetical protein ACJ73N_15535 [Bryobacteraceae bacterium]
MSEKPRGVTRQEVETFIHLHKLSAKGHAGQALLTAAILDQELMAAILKKMRPLSKAKQERLFTALGAPLAEFANKIEMAYALDQIDDDTRAKLRMIKDIRNKFAHLPKECTFWTREISAFIAKFKCTEKATNPQIFGLMAEACFNHLAERSAESAVPTPSPGTEQ